MPENNDNLGFSLGYSNDHDEVVNYLHDAGFTGVRNLSIELPKNYDCNDLRTEIQNQAEENGAFWFYFGPHDYSPQPACYFYKFNFDLRPENHIG